MRTQKVKFQNPKFTTHTQAEAFSHLEIMYSGFKPEHFLRCQVTLLLTGLRAVTDPHRPLGDPEVQDISETFQEISDILDSVRDIFTDDIA